MVTSSAVVGSSAISRLRIAGDGHGDHDALAHAAGQLVREGVEAASRLRGCRPAPAARTVRSRRSRARAAFMRLQRFHDLVADGEAGVEAGHRLLEDHGDVLADDLAARARLQAQQVDGRRSVMRSAVTLPGQGSGP